MIFNKYITFLIASIVESLQEYLPVDVYGVCGPLQCSATEQDYCYKMLEKNYKFYIAFENSLCTDYVTEKFFDVAR